MLPMNAMNAPHFHDDDKARAYLESIRWPNGPVCPHCSSENEYRLEGVGGEKGTKARAGLLKCGDCKKQYSVTVGTVFERSKIPLSKWLLAAFLLCSSKKGISAHQLSRTLAVTYKTAWFLAHRIRFAMADTTGGGLMGSGGGAVEADETYIGKKKGAVVRAGAGHKNQVFALVDRTSGRVKSKHVSNFAEIGKTLRENVSPEAKLYTDQAKMYRQLGKQFAAHEAVNHSKEEWKRGAVHTNTIEGVFSVFKRGMVGTYQHCGSQHLQRYLAEFDFRYNARVALGVNDNMRTRMALEGIEGKRLTYK
jgi:transposase-like protein